MTAKHTPGPWRDCEPGSNFAKSKKFIRPVGDEKLIAVVSGERPFLEVAANARLIAAAPELYAALRELLYWAKHERDGGPCDGCDPGNEGSEIWCELTGKIEAALAKAEGRSDPKGPSASASDSLAEGRKGDDP